MKSLTCFSSRSRGTCCAVILERLAENCRGRTTAIICTRTNAPKYILESHRLHFGSICDQNGYNFEPWSRRFGSGCIVECSGTDISHTLSSYFPNIIGLVQRTVRFVMRTVPKASYRTVQYEYAYRFTITNDYTITPLIYILFYLFIAIIELP